MSVRIKQCRFLKTRMCAVDRKCWVCARLHVWARGPSSRSTNYFLGEEGQWHTNHSQTRGARVSRGCLSSFFQEQQYWCFLRKNKLREECNAHIQFRVYMFWAVGKPWTEDWSTTCFAVSAITQQKEAQGRLIMNCPWDTRLQKRVLWKWIPRMKGLLLKRRISGSGERVGTGQGDSLGQWTLLKLLWGSGKTTHHEIIVKADLFWGGML